MGGANHVLELYGVESFLEDVDRDRQFWREAACRCERRARSCECDRGRETAVSASLSWLAGAGFPEFAQAAELRYNNAHEFRNRFLLMALGLVR
jgi:hypothetical protein